MWSNTHREHEESNYLSLASPSQCSWKSIHIHFHSCTAPYAYYCLVALNKGTWLTWIYSFFITLPLQVINSWNSCSLLHFYVSFIYTLFLAIRWGKAFGFLQILNHSVPGPEMGWKQSLLAHLKINGHLKTSSAHPSTIKHYYINMTS